MKIKLSTLQLNTGQIEGVPANPRTITEKDFESLKDSLTRNPDNIKKFPLVIAEHKGQLVVISGNQRLRAMRSLGWTELDHVGEIYPEGTDPDILCEAVIIANTHKGEWDWDILANEWDQDMLEEWGVDIDKAWATTELPGDIDNIPQAPKKHVSKLGDLWLLDNHRVLCGDSTDKTTVEKLMDGKKADMVFTDPPYGMEFQSNFRKKTPQFDKIENDDVVLDITQPLQQIMADNCVAYVCTRWDLYPQWFQQIKTILNIKNCVVWYKRGGGLGDLENTYSPNHEFLIVGHKGKNPLKGKRDADVWEIGRDGFNDYEHPTQKPVALPAFAIEHHSDKGQNISDLFLGSGSTLIACEQTDRTCYGLELDEHYVDVICKRWQTLTGQMPILESTGEAHDFIG